MKVSKESRTIISKHLQEEVVFNDLNSQRWIWNEH
jgi:hypothetical protein